MIKFTEKKPCNYKMQGNGIHLIPYKIEPYILDFKKTTYLNIYNTLFVVDINGNETKLDFKYIDNHIALTNIVFDDINLCYLKIKSIENDINKTTERIYYSQLITISSYNEHLTTRIDYKCKKEDVLLSCQIDMYERNEKREVEIDSYYRISTQNTVSYVTKNTKYTRYVADFLNINVANALSDLFVGSYVYFNYERVCLFEPIEIDSPEAQANFVDVEVNATKLNERIENTYIVISEDNKNLITENNILIDKN